MTVGELYEMVLAHVPRRDFSMLEFVRLLRWFHIEAYRKANFFSLSKTSILTPSSNWTFVLPDDFGDDISVLSLGKETVFASPLFPITSSNDFLAIVGSRNLSYLSSIQMPTVGAFYYIGVPSEVWTNYNGIITVGMEDLKSVNVYPPIDTNRYELSLLYYPVPVVTTAVDESYETPLMRKYPEWVLAEMIARVYLMFRDIEGAQVFKEQAMEKFLEAKANEAREVLSPAKTLHLKAGKYKRKPLPLPPVPQGGG